MRTYRQFAGGLAPALLDMLRRSIFGDYPTGFLTSAAAVRVYLKGAMGSVKAGKKNGVNCELVHTPFAAQPLSLIRQMSEGDCNVATYPFYRHCGPVHWGGGAVDPR
jgi:hypothetical protein